MTVHADRRLVSFKRLFGGSRILVVMLVSFYGLLNLVYTASWSALLRKTLWHRSNLVLNFLLMSSSAGNDA